MNPLPTLYFAIPAMDEAETLPKCLECISQQTYPNISVVICLNQPESYWSDPQKTHICESNAKTLDFLKKNKILDITVIDRSSKSFGWTGKNHGVGWARKTVMDYIATTAMPQDIIICMDADTTFKSDFCNSINEGFKAHRDAVGMALPYYHCLTGDAALDRALLRYEIYMRYYALNMFRIHNPYCFTAIGSSMATTVKAYRSVKGMAPKLSGEDFYFLQKLRKHGKIIISNDECTYPATRYSDRVFFGTGPALIKGKNNQWESYPMYSYKLFDEVKQTYDLFDTLFNQNIETPMSEFLSDTFNTKDFWQPIRDNFKTLPLFRKSCAEKVDGLRILQYLKSKQSLSDNEATYLTEYLEKFHKGILAENNIEPDDFTFESSSIADLDIVRNILFRIEENCRQQIGLIDWY